MEPLERLNSRHDNNFNLLRLIAAIFVIITHSYALLGLRENDLLNRLTHGLISFSQLGLYSFFVMSGFLVYASLERSTSFISFFKKRALRIFPALATVIILTTFVLGPLLTHETLKTYFTNSETYRYLGGLSLYRITYTLPGVFTYNPYPRAVNGSLWTLPYEWTCYMLLAAAYGIAKRNPRLTLAAAALATLAIRTIVGRYQIAQVIPFFNLDMRQLMLFGTFFILGALTYQVRSALMLRGWITFVALTALWLASGTRAGLYILLPTLPYFVAYAAAVRLPKKIAVWFTDTDYSYGVYIYAFPLGQILVALFRPHLSALTLTLATLAATLPFAVLSWHCIEKPFLKLKKEPEKAP